MFSNLKFQHLKSVEMKYVNIYLINAHVECLFSEFIMAKYRVKIKKIVMQNEMIKDIGRAFTGLLIRFNINNCTIIGQWLLLYCTVSQSSHRH